MVNLKKTVGDGPSLPSMFEDDIHIQGVINFTYWICFVMFSDQSSMVNLKRRLLEMVLVCPLCLKMTNIYKVSLVKSGYVEMET